MIDNKNDLVEEVNLYVGGSLDGTWRISRGRNPIIRVYDISKMPLAPSPNDNPIPTAENIKFDYYKIVKFHTPEGAIRIRALEEMSVSDVFTMLMKNYRPILSIYES